MDQIFSVYLGAESEKGFSGFVAENNFYCILEILKDIRESKEEWCFKK